MSIQSLNELQNVSKDVTDLLDRVLSSLYALVSGDLVGLYLYGSLVQGCFNPDHSDVDLMAVVKNPFTDRQKRRLEEFYQDLVQEPGLGKRLEMIFFTPDHVRKPVFPSPYLLSFGHGKFAFPKNEDDLDPDLPMTLRHLYDYGMALVGPEPKELIRPVAWEILEPSIKEDILYSLRGAHKWPMYAVLNLCRGFYSLKTQDVSISKKQAGQWGQTAFPSRFHLLIATALAAYQDQLTNEHHCFLLEHLDPFLEHCRDFLDSERWT